VTGRTKKKKIPAYKRLKNATRVPDVAEHRKKSGKRKLIERKKPSRKREIMGINVDSVGTDRGLRANRGRRSQKRRWLGSEMDQELSQSANRRCQGMS